MTLFLFLLCAVAAILLMGGYYTYRIAFYSPKKGRDKISTFASHKYDPYRKEINRLFCQLSDRPYEEVSIESFDGFTLFGRYYHVKDGAPLDIGFHGYRSSALTDFAGGSELSFSMGHNLLLIDERAHGRSEGRTITFGIQERWDADSWVRYAVERFGADTEIILYGVSMGAATVLMAAGLDLPENVKGIIARLHCDGPKTVYIEAAGECEVTAGDIKADGEVEILNPELHIASLGPDGALSMEITLAHGRGYVPADKNKSAQQVIGTIPVDSIYAPVLKVNYAVENTRVGNQTDFDKLTIEVWTDKTISARDALSLGAKILCDHFTLFTDLSDTIGNSCTVVEKEPERPDTVMKMTIEELDLSVRSFNCLKRANINTVEDLTNKTEEEMIKVRNLGRKSLEEVEHKLAMMGLSLASDDNQ